MRVTLTPLPQVTVDDAPTLVVVTGPGAFGLALSPEAAALPEPFVDTLNRIAIEERADESCVVCGRPVGFRFNDDLEMAFWHPLVLTLTDRDGADVIESCPTCTPDPL